MLQWLDETAPSPWTSDATIGPPSPRIGMRASFACRTTPLNAVGSAGSINIAFTLCTIRLESWVTCLSTLA